MAYPSLSSVIPTTYMELEKDYVGTKSEYQDGGADYLLYADTPIRRWVITYETATTTERDLFRTLGVDSKYNSEEGSLLGFDFTPRGESLISGVRLDKGGLVCVARKSWIHSIAIRLIKRP